MSNTVDKETTFKIKNAISKNTSPRLTDRHYRLPWLMARILEWKFLTLIFFTMYSSIGSLAVRSLSSVALERLNFYGRESTKLKINSVKGECWLNGQTISRSLWLNVLDEKVILPSGCFHPQDHQGRTPCQHPPSLKLKKIIKNKVGMNIFFFFTFPITFIILKLYLIYSQWP